MTTSVTLNSHLYTYETDIIGADGYAWTRPYAGAPSQGPVLFSLLNDFIHETQNQLASVAAIQGLAASTTGNIPISNGSTWVRSSGSGVRGLLDSLTVGTDPGTANILRVGGSIATSADLQIKDGNAGHGILSDNATRVLAIQNTLITVNVPMTSQSGYITTIGANALSVSPAIVASVRSNILIQAADASAVARNWYIGANVINLNGDLHINDGASVAKGIVIGNATGWLGVGIVPTAPLTVVSSSSGGNTAIIQNSGSTPFGVVIGFTAAAPNDTTHYLLDAVDSGTHRATIYSNGGLANFSANNVNLSDARTKVPGWLPLLYDVDTFARIPLRKYKYLDQTHEYFNFGVVADELEAVDDHFVDEFAFGPRTRNDDSEIEDVAETRKMVFEHDLFYAHMSVTQQLVGRIAKLEKKLATLSTN